MAYAKGICAGLKLTFDILDGKFRIYYFSESNRTFISYSLKVYDLFYLIPLSR